MAKYEIINNGKRILHGNDSFSIPVIWNNIIKKNEFSLAEHSNYLKFIKSRGFEDGSIELKKDGITIDTAKIKLP